MSKIWHLPIRSGLAERGADIGSEAVRLKGCAVPVPQGNLTGGRSGKLCVAIALPFGKLLGGAHVARVHRCVGVCRSW